MHMKTKIIVDLDDTLADIEHRRKFYGVDWTAYNMNSVNDPINEDVLNLCNRFGNDVIILTGRFELYRECTEKWLSDNKVLCESVIMKPNGDMRSSYHFKTEWIKSHESEILAVFDDREDIRQFCTNLNIITIVPNKLEK